MNIFNLNLLRFFLNCFYVKVVLISNMILKIDKYKGDLLMNLN